MPVPGKNNAIKLIVRQAPVPVPGKKAPGSDCALNALAIDEPLEYARLYLDGTMQMWIDAKDSF